MLNEPNADELSGDANSGGAQEAAGVDRPSDEETATITMTPRDREAIERVNFKCNIFQIHFNSSILFCFFFPFLCFAA